MGLAMSTALQAQVPKNVIVEHTTNTLCSICAGRNPGFYSNLASNPAISHISIHPSSPYSACILNQHNVSENDGRTNYYSVYGGTPRLIIQGDVISTGADYSSATIFAPYTGQTTEASIAIQQTKYQSDSIQVQVVVKTEASHSYGNLRLFVALAEDTVFYNAPNGENEHYDVFRKALTPVDGSVMTLPAAVGDSLIFNYSYPADPAWNFDRIETVVILNEESTKQVVQSQVAEAAESTITAVDEQHVQLGLSPNPAFDVVRLEDPNVIELWFYDLNGKLAYAEPVIVGHVDVGAFEPGTYLVVGHDQNGIAGSTLLTIQ